MAAQSAANDQESTWELSKENVQPVKSGRNVNCIAAVLQPSKQDMERLMKEKQRFEEEIIAGNNEEDPIEAWDRYLKWTIQYFPSGGNDLTRLNLLKKFIMKFEKCPQYRNDIRYVNAWLKLAEIMKDAFETFSYMNTEGIGIRCAEFYVAWADEYEKYGDIRRADRIYNDGDEKCAQPRELLQRKHMEFQLRIARGMLDKTESAHELCSNSETSQQRVPLNQLRGKGKNHSVGTQRTGRALQSLQVSSSSWGRPVQNHVQQSNGFEIFEDDASSVSVMGEAGKWASAPMSATLKENSLKPEPWNGIKVKQKYVPSQLMSSVPAIPVNHFTVYEDENQGSAPGIGHKVASNVEFVLSEKKATKADLNDFKSAIGEKPVHEADMVSGYDVDKVYTVMGEMQFEEVRAAHWRRRQRIKAEQVARMELEQQEREMEERRMQRMKMMIAQRQKFEEERRKFDEDRMKLLELERKVMESERMRMQQKQMELENRLREIKILGKTAKTEEEEKMLQQEEEDITIQLNTVKRNIKRASLANVNNEEENGPGNSDDFVIFDENAPALAGQENEGRSNVLRNQCAGLRPTSLNSSLNHSERSIPSPTTNTKEAMNQVDTWFQKSLDDDGNLSCSVAVPENFGNDEKAQRLRENPPYSFKPINSPTESPRLPALQKTESFEIFAEDENSGQRFPNHPVVKKKGLAARPPSKPENAIQTFEDQKETGQQEEDKTGICFDDVTVAGSHFAAKARLASTPFCNKIEKVQDATAINHLSRIQSEITDNIYLYSGPGQIGRNSETGDIRKQWVAEGDAQETDKLFCTVQPEKNNDEIPDEAKLLSPIMEASNESEKSSVIGTAKSSKSHYGESDRLHSAMKSFASFCPPTPNFESPAAAERSDVFCFDHYLANGSIDCNLWGEDEETSDKKDERDESVKNVDPDGDFTRVSSLHASMRDNEKRASGEKNKDIDEICKDLNATSVSSKNLVPNSNLSDSLNIIHDPWKDELLNSIVHRQGLVAKGSSITVHYAEDAMAPKLRKGVQVNLGGESLRFGQVMGEGAYAKVFDLIHEAGEPHRVVKAQFPPCPWEVYIISQAKTRLEEKGMKDLADTIVDVESAHFFKDGSLLLMPHMSKGTLLDVINSKKGTVIKDVVAMWIAHQVMRIVHGLHTVGIIHGDVKPDNFMIEQGNSLRGGTGGISLIDFGRSIDLTQMPPGVAFTKNCGTSAFTCIQMQNKEPWNYHTDFYGIAGTLHAVLFGAYMKVHQGKDGSWEINNKIKRWYNASLWKDFFTSLLNFPSPTKDKPANLADSPLPRLISEMRNLLEETSSNETDAVTAFFKNS